MINVFKGFPWSEVQKVIGLRFQVAGVSSQMTEDRKQRSDGDFIFPVDTICRLSSDLYTLIPET
jgi:hypothetical protein